MGFAIPIERWISTRNLERLWMIYSMNQVGKNSDGIKKILKIWLDYKKYGSFTPQSIWMYAMAGLWLNR